MMNALDREDVYKININWEIHKDFDGLGIHVIERYGSRPSRFCIGPLPDVETAYCIMEERRDMYRKTVARLRGLAELTRE